MRLIFAKLAAIITIIGMSITLSGCEYRYRYPCQDPANWDNPECNNEACRADGTCTSDTLGPGFFRDRKEEEVVIPQETTEEPVESVNSDCNCEDKPKSKAKPNFKDGDPVVMDPEGDEYEIPSRTPQSLDEEVPVTMNTIVDTAAHNAATK